MTKILRCRVVSHRKKNFEGKFRGQDLEISPKKYLLDVGAVPRVGWPAHLTVRVILTFSSVGMGWMFTETTSSYGNKPFPRESLRRLLFVSVGWTCGGRLIQNELSKRRIGSSSHTTYEILLEAIFSNNLRAVTWDVVIICWKLQVAINYLCCAIFSGY